MERYRDLYKSNRLLISTKETRNEGLCCHRKIKRSEAFDVHRNVSPELKESKPKKIKKVDNKENLRKRLKDKSKKIVPKPTRPFIVGVVRHKIHSPPFLHGPIIRAKPQNNLYCQPTPVKSFAPKNYKFNAPTGLKVNFPTPKTQTSPFTLRSLFKRKEENNTKTKESPLRNVTVRRPLRQISNISPFRSNASHFEKSKVEELWTEPKEGMEDERPVFGRLNLLKIFEASTQKISKDNLENNFLSSKVDRNFDVKKNLNDNKLFDSPRDETKKITSIECFDKTPILEKIKLSETSFDIKKDDLENKTPQFLSVNLSETTFTSYCSKTSNKTINFDESSTPKKSDDCITSLTHSLPFILKSEEINNYLSPSEKKISSESTSDIENENSSNSILYETVIKANDCLNVMAQKNSDICLQTKQIDSDKIVDLDNIRNKHHVPLTISSPLDNISIEKEEMNKTLTEIEQERISNISPIKNQNRVLNEITSSISLKIDETFENSIQQSKKQELQSIKKSECKENDQNLVINKKSSTISLKIDNLVKTVKQSEANSNSKSEPIGSDIIITNVDVANEQQEYFDADRHVDNLLQSFKDSNSKTESNSSIQHDTLSPIDNLLNNIESDNKNQKIELENKIGCENIKNNLDSQLTNFVSLENKMNPDMDFKKLTNPKQQTQLDSLENSHYEIIEEINTNYSESDINQLENDHLNSKIEDANSEKSSHSKRNSTLYCQSKRQSVEKLREGIEHTDEVNKSDSLNAEQIKTSSSIPKNLSKQLEEQSNLENSRSEDITHKNIANDLERKHSTFLNKTLENINTIGIPSSLIQPKYQIKITTPFGTEKNCTMERKSHNKSTNEDVKTKTYMQHPETVTISDSPDIKKEILIHKSRVKNSNEVIDLVSDEEEDHTVYLSKVLARISYNSVPSLASASPKANQKRVPIGSIENIPKLHISPCKTPRSNLIAKENSPINSPLRVLSLRSRHVEISPSPKKSTPRKPRRKKLDQTFTQEK